MGDGQQLLLKCENADVPFAASVMAYASGGWVAVIEVADGATVSKWFEDEQAGRPYPQELAAWLRTPRA